MIQFKPYPSIGNAADAEWMALVRESVGPETPFAVQEKVDGEHVTFLSDDLDVRMALRTALLGSKEMPFGFQAVLDRYSGRIYHIYNLLRPAWPDMDSIAVNGELVGDEFCAFDLYVFTEDGGCFLPVMEANVLFSTAGLLYARNLFVGPLDECLAYPHVFPSRIPVELGLPPDEDDLCGGIVLKPLEPVVLPDGRRVAVQVKATAT